MKFYVSDIEFDFNTDMPDYYSVSHDDQQLIINDNLGVWEADDEDDLIEEITANAGWCITVSYTHLTLPTSDLV